MPDHRIGPGARSLTQDIRTSKPESASSTPGKMSLVDSRFNNGTHQGSGAITSSTSADGVYPPTSAAVTRTATFDVGKVHIEETVGATLSHGSQPMTFNLTNGILTIGDERIGVDLKSHAAAAGKRLDVTGADVEVTRGPHERFGAQVRDGYFGYQVTSTWTLTSKGSHPWQVEFSVSAFAGTKPPHHWWDHIPELGALDAAASAVLGIAKVVVTSAPGWGEGIAEDAAAVGA